MTAQHFAMTDLIVFPELGFAGCTANGQHASFSFPTFDKSATLFVLQRLRSTTADIFHEKSLHNYKKFANSMRQRFTTPKKCDIL